LLAAVLGLKQIVVDEFNPITMEVRVEHHNEVMNYPVLIDIVQ
jgi:hypothetical protein